MIIVLLWRVGFSLSVKRCDRSTAQMIDAFRRTFIGNKGWRHFVGLLRWGEPAKVLGRTAALLPHIFDCGHFLPLTCPEELGAHLIPFLERTG